MHTTTITPTRTGVRLAATLAQAWDGLRAGAVELAAAWLRNQERRATERALRQLSPYLLRDLGLDRGDIPSIAAAAGGDSDLTRRLLAHS